MPQSVPIAFKPIGKPEIGHNNYAGFQPGKTEVLPKGWNGFNAKPLASDIRVDHDVEFKTRDGSRLYADIYRPEGFAQEKLPAIISWSPYGKKYSALAMLPMCVWNCCVSKDDLSGIEKFEGLDPQAWCPRGYAVISVDARGAGDSDGFMHIMGSQDAEDCYDVIEAIAELPWCNGAIGMAGNSALAIIQWLVAALQPPHLAAIAPWEGSGDIYREQFCRGGWFQMSNFDLITREILKGKVGVEDFAEMYKRYPLSNEYWADKRADMTKIQCPVYISGSDFSSIHTMGAVRGWMELPHDNKWIRWSSYQEWYELYCVKSADEELHRYFDRYLKGIENGWEKDTPKVRWSALQFGDREAIDDIEYSDFPIPGTEYKKFFLQNGTLNNEPAEKASITSYDSESSSDVADFTYTFKERTRLIGLPKAVIHVSCDEKDDMVVFINLRKRDKDGNLLMHLTFPFDATPYKSIADIPKKEMASLNLHLGSLGILRASHRAYDTKRSIHPQFPFGNPFGIHPHEKEEKITPGEIVRLEIGIWAMGVDFEAGESISVQIGGQLPSIAEFTAWSSPRPEEEKNKGTHKIHSGPEHTSSIILPFVPL